MTILVSDANIFIDMALGGLTLPMFRLDDIFATPDVLYQEELSANHPELPGLGLRIERLSGDGVARVIKLKNLYDGPSTNDLFALALAQEHLWTLLSGDRRLRAVAVQEGVEVHGTLWLVERMVTHGAITAARASAGFGTMRDAGRRLPWDKVEEMLATHSQP